MLQTEVPKGGGFLMFTMHASSNHEVWSSCLSFQSLHFRHFSGFAAAVVTLAHLARGFFGGSRVFSMDPLGRPMREFLKTLPKIW